MREGLELQVCILQAAAGWGKTTAARAALDGRAHRWIDLGSAPDEPGVLFAELARAFGLYHAYSPGDLAVDLVSRIERDPGIVAIDDVHEIAEDAPSLELLRCLVETRPDVRLLLIGRKALPLPTATWAANGMATIPITEDDLAIGTHEIREVLAASDLRGDDATIAAIAEIAQGWAVAMRFAVMALRRSRELGRVAAIGRDLAFKFLAEQALGDFDERQTGLLRDLALAGPFDEPLVAELEAGDAGRFVRWMQEAGIPLHRSTAQTRLHDLFAAFLVAHTPETERAQRAARVATALAARDRAGDALDVLRFHAPAASCAFLERHGLALLQEGRRNSVKSAIAVLPARARRDNPVILMLRALLEYGAGNFSQAQILSDRAVEKADRDATFFLDLLRFRAILKLYESREDAAEWIERIMRSASEEAREVLRGPYAIFLCFFGEVGRAVEEIETVIARAEASDDATAMARAYTWAMTVYVHAGAYERGLAVGETALALHERSRDLRGVTVVRNTRVGALFAFSDDRQETLRQARGYHAAARAWDDPVSVKQSAAVLYELAVELGDDAEASELARLIGDTDASFGGVAWYRLARATVLGATGDFASGVRLLHDVAERVSDPLERWCAYAAAAMFFALAGDGENAARELARFDRCGPGQNAIARRVKRLCDVYAGYAEIFLGRAAAALKRFPEPQLADEAALVAAGTELAKVGLRSSSEEAVAAIVGELASRGQIGFSRLVAAAAKSLRPHARDFGLTQAEVRVLGSLALGMSPKRIAAESGRSVETVRNQVKSVIRKMGVSGRLQAIAAAREAGLI